MAILLEVANVSVGRPGSHPLNYLIFTCFGNVVLQRIKNHELFGNGKVNIRFKNSDYFIHQEKLFFTTTNAASVCSSRSNCETDRVQLNRLSFALLLPVPCGISPIRKELIVQSWGVVVIQNSFCNLLVDMR